MIFPFSQSLMDKTIDSSPSLPPKRGRFIVLEGGEGTGKSTHALWIESFLLARGLEVFRTREPGGTPQGEKLRALLVRGGDSSFLPLSEVLLLLAARLEHWERGIRQALDKGHWVVCDRFSLSTLAYQGYGQGLDLDQLTRLMTEILGPIVPDLTFVFDLDPQIGLARALGRSSITVDSSQPLPSLPSSGEGETRFEHLGLPFHQRVRQGYLTLAQRAMEGGLPYHLIDATQSLEATQHLLVPPLLTLLEKNLQP